MTPEQKQLLREADKTPFGRAVSAFLDDEEKKLNTDLRSETSTFETIRGAQKGLKVIDRLRVAMGQDKPTEKTLNPYT